MMHVYLLGWSLSVVAPLTRATWARAVDVVGGIELGGHSHHKHCRFIGNWENRGMENRMMDLGRSGLESIWKVCVYRGRNV
jgi:hypothetical protein